MATLDTSKKYEEEGDNAIVIDRLLVLQSCNQLFSKPDRSQWMSLFGKLAILEQRGELESLTETEKGDLFFAITKVFAKADPEIKCVALDLVDSPTLHNPSAFILFSSVAKCLTTDSDIVCGRAIKWIFNNVDHQEVMNTNAFRQMEASLGSRDAPSDYPASVIALALEKGCLDPKSSEGMKSIIGQKFRTSLNSRLSSRESYCQLPILRVLRFILNDDAMFKLMSNSRLTLSPLANVQLLRFIRRMWFSMEHKQPRLLQIIHQMLKKKSEMVNLEACKVLLDLAPPEELQPVVRVLQDMLTSPRSCVRFAAAKQFSKLASKHPMLMSNCFNDLENLITDCNRSIACMAITALLQSGSEESVSRLLKQISTFLGELDDSRKSIIVTAVSALKKFKSKISEILLFLANLLRDEGGAELKRAVFKSMVAIMEDDPTCAEHAMNHLSEFIEDCEHDDLSCQVLHFLGEHSGAVKNPSKYIRLIYNRVILESPSVRAAAVSALSSIALSNPTLRLPIRSLLETTVKDNQSSVVRHRAAHGICTLDDLPEGSGATKENADAEPLDLDALEYSLQNYLSQDSPGQSPFTNLDINARPRETKKEKVADAFASPEKPKEVIRKTNAYKNAVNQYTQLQELGSLIRSTVPEQLTEPEAEQLVELQKHVHEKHVVFQFDVQNTADDQHLANVRIELELEDAEGLEFEDFALEIAALPPNGFGSIYLVVRREEDTFDAYMDATLHFVVKDPENLDDEGYEDEGPLNAVALTVKDFTRKPTAKITERDFATVWGLPNLQENKVDKKGSLPNYNTIEEAIEAIVEHGTLYPVGTTATNAGDSHHKLLLAGTFMQGMSVYGMIQFKMKSGGSGVRCKLEVCAEDADVAQMVLSDLERSLG